MSGEPVSPATTIAVIAGASQFPLSPGLASGRPFAGSAKAFREYLLSPDGFGLPEANLLDLFDSAHQPPELVVTIGEFIKSTRQRLSAERGVRDFLFFYVGHGGFTDSRDYFLASQATREGFEGATSIRMADLARAIKRSGGGIRRFLILDCCFSGSAQKEFMGDTLELARSQTAEAMADSGAPPGTGTSILCSSSSRDVSIAPENEEYTMFSGALLEVLRQGIPRMAQPITLAALGERTKNLIRERHGLKGVRPEVSSPDQREDELRDVPLFPNPALRYRRYDCTITITDDAALTLEYPDAEGKTQRISGPFGSDPFAKLTVERLNDWVNLGLRLNQEKLREGWPCELEDLKLIGVNLYRTLFEGEVREAFLGVYRRFRVAYESEDRGSTNLRMRLRLIFNRRAEAIARLPWEFLILPGADGDEMNGSFFAGERTELTLTRYVPPSATVKPAKAEPLRIMVAVYTPSGEDGIDALEREGLLNRLRAITTDVVLIEDAPWQRLRKELREFRPHVFHFVGYGAFDEGKRGGIALVGSPEEADDVTNTASDDKRVLPFAGKALLSLFDYEARPRMVFLHACKTRAANRKTAFESQEAFKACARELVFERIASVVAMQFGMSHKEIAAFAAEVYKELAGGKGIDEAVKIGRERLGGQHPAWSHPRFGAPLVYLQSDDPVVIPEPTPIEAPGQKPRDAVVAPPTGAAGVPVTRPPGTRGSGSTSPATQGPPSRPTDGSSFGN